MATDSRIAEARPRAFEHMWREYPAEQSRAEGKNKDEQPRERRSSIRYAREVSGRVVERIEVVVGERPSGLIS